MDILVLNPFFYPYQGGTEKVILHVGKRLSKKHNFTILTAQLKGAPLQEELDNMKIIRTPAKVFYDVPRPIPPPVPILTRLKQDIKRLIPDYDIAHIHNRFIYGSSTGKIVKNAGKKLCLTIHNSRPEGIDIITDTFGQIYDNIATKRLIYMCNGITAVSNATLQSTIPNDFPGLKRTIYNGVDQKLFRPKKSTVWTEKLNIDKPVILTNARLVQQKGIRYLIEAMKGLNATLVVFGRGPLKAGLERHARQLNIDARFVSEGISDRQLASLYNCADCFALPSLYEPCALALIEAMGCGLPLVATNAGGNSEIVKHGKNGYVVPVRDSDSIHRSLKKFLDDKKLRTTFGKESRKMVEKYFNWDTTAKAFDKFYSDIS